MSEVVGLERCACDEVGGCGEGRDVLAFLDCTSERIDAIPR